MADKPLVSIVIPIYNEEKILEEAITQLYADLESFKDRYDFEVILAENGSTDRTVELGKELSKRFSGLSIFHYHEPDYGLALKEGINRAKGELVFCDEIDLCLKDFYERALEIFETDPQTEMVIGSKTLKGAEDKRPFLRRFATFVLNAMLRVLLGFRGTDTHGIKAFRRERLLPIVNRCMVGKDIFASEMVIRAEREGLKIREIPISLHEKRPPSINLFKRVPKVISNIAYLFWVLRIKRK